jgi:AcrR family transcriptional regulator
MSKKLAVLDICQEQRVDPRVTRTRKLIVGALRELLGEGRFADITVQDIAERATVNRATFYSHFEDKFALLEEMMAEDLLRRLAKSLPPKAPLDSDHLELFALAVFEFFGEIQSSCTHKREFGPVFETTMQTRIQEFLRHWLEHQPESKLAHQSPPAAFAAVYGWAIFGAASNWSRSVGRGKVEDAVRQTLDVLIHETLFRKSAPRDNLG